MIDCGGCQGLGNHKRLCPRHPDYHPWRQYAMLADRIGDAIGSNDPFIANKAYGLGADIRQLILDRPWHGLNRVPEDT